MDPFTETEGKSAHDPLYMPWRTAAAATTGFPIGVDHVYIPGPVIVGAGPAGLAVAACLTVKGVKYALLERYDCIASLWRHRTYDRLKLHLPKRFCELPLMPFPESFPKYPTRDQFLEYLEDYKVAFNIHPMFRQNVVSAEYDGELWNVRAKEVISATIEGEEVVLSSTTRVYRSRWLVVATGENAEPVVPEIEGIETFKGHVMHSSEYRSGKGFQDKKALVVGCGNSGMEVALDLANHNVHTSIVVRDTLHVLPKEIIGYSTFGISVWLLRWLPIQVVDWVLLLLARLVLGDTACLGISRPSIGPLELKKVYGKTPVIDVGTIDKIKSGDIQVFPRIQRFQKDDIEFIDGRIVNFDIIILATGFKSNVPFWLKDEGLFSEKNGFPQKPNEWKGENGLYAIGFSRRGLLGVSMDAIKAADDIMQCLHNMDYEKQKGNKFCCIN